MFQQSHRLPCRVLVWYLSRTGRRRQVPPLSWPTVEKPTPHPHHSRSIRQRYWQVETNHTSANLWVGPSYRPRTKYDGMCYIFSLFVSPQGGGYPSHWCLVSGPRSFPGEEGYLLTSLWSQVLSGRRGYRSLWSQVPSGERGYPSQDHHMGTGQNQDRIPPPPGQNQDRVPPSPPPSQDQDRVFSSSRSRRRSFL